MTKTVEAIYEDKVFKPLSPLEGLRDHQRVEISVYVPPSKEGLSKLVGTMSMQEAEEMKATIDREFEHIDNER